VNSIDKNENGDYLLSARFTDAIYLISGQDGQILWRLGGKLNNFEKDFRIYRQHNARFMESNATHMTISFFNNASDELTTDEDVSSVLVVQLNTAMTPMTATLLRRYKRPDGGLSRLRGNAQLLPNGNWFAGWSEFGYHTEFTDDGTCVMEAKFVSERFNTYRAYKYEFHGFPQDPPDVRAFVYGSQSSRLTTVFHVSWNGATEVASWNFYAQAGADKPPVLIGNTTKLGFESTFITDGYLDWVSVDAIDAQGSIIGRSAIENTITPDDWHAVGFDSDDPLPAPQDPDTIVSADDDGEAEGSAEGEPNDEEGDYVADYEGDEEGDDEGYDEEEDDDLVNNKDNNDNSKAIVYNDNKNIPKLNNPPQSETALILDAEQSRGLAAQMTWKCLNGIIRVFILLLVIRFILVATIAQSRTFRRCFRRLRVSVLRHRSYIEIPSDEPV
jgi:Arylsulfotransferase (ASST)